MGNRNGRSNPLQGRKAVVVGGSGGIGAAISRRLIRFSAETYIVGGRDPAKIDRLKEEARNAPGSLKSFPCDIERSEDLLELISKLPDFEILICSFGPFLEGDLHTASPSEWKRISELNLSLPGILVSRYLGKMMEEGFGRIVLFGGSATDTIRGYRKTSIYAAAKTGLGVIARSVAKQYAQYNITCNVICPGYVDTEYYTEEEKRKIRTRMPQNMLISTEEIADIVEYVLLTPSINGAVIPVNSGIMR